MTEILLQRTRAKTVARFAASFFVTFPNWAALAGDEDGKLEDYLKPIGMWRRRSIGLRALASEMVRRGGRFPGDRESIEALPAVGQYIANSILLLCKQQPEPLLDVNMARVLERYFGPRQLADIRYDPYLQKLSRLAVAAGDARTVNWAILDLAALVCRAKGPACSACPLKSGCEFSINFSRA